MLFLKIILGQAAVMRTGCRLQGYTTVVIQIVPAWKC